MAVVLVNPACLLPEEAELNEPPILRRRAPLNPFTILPEGCAFEFSTYVFDDDDSSVLVRWVAYRAMSKADDFALIGDELIADADQTLALNENGPVFIELQKKRTNLSFVSPGSTYTFVAFVTDSPEWGTDTSDHPAPLPEGVTRRHARSEIWWTVEFSPNLPDATGCPPFDVATLEFEQ